MFGMTKNLWQDDAGFIVSIELILIASVAIIGSIVGLTAIRDAVISELSDVAGAIQDLNQSYRYYGVLGHSASTAGADYVDMKDFCDSEDDPAGQADNCIEFEQDPTNEE